MNDNEPLSILRVVEFVVAVVALGLLTIPWVWSWFRGGLLAGLWYGG